MWSPVQCPPWLMQRYESQKNTQHQSIPNLEIFNLELYKETQVRSSFQPTAWGISISQYLLQTKVSSMNYSQLCASTHPWTPLFSLCCQKRCRVSSIRLRNKSPLLTCINGTAKGAANIMNVA